MMVNNWDETADTKLFTVSIPSDVDVKKEDVEEAVESVIEEAQTDVEETKDDDARRFDRGHQC